MEKPGVFSGKTGKFLVEKPGIFRGKPGFFGGTPGLWKTGNF